MNWHSPKPSAYVVVVEFHIRSEAIAVFLPLLLANARASLEREPGCQVFDVCQVGNSSTQFLLYEVYENEAAFKSHLESDHYLSFAAETASSVESKEVRVMGLISTARLPAQLS